MSEHRGDTTHTRDKSVITHFNKVGHYVKDMNSQILEILTGNPDLEKNTLFMRKRESSGYINYAPYNHRV